MEESKTLIKMFNDSASLYDEWHFAADSAFEYVERKRLNIMTPYLINLHGRKVLDVAYGTGTYLDIARRNGSYAVGCDISKSMILNISK